MKAIIIGFSGEILTKQLKKKIKDLVNAAIYNYDVTDFYFGNREENEDDDEISEKPYLKELVANSRNVLDFVAKTINVAKKETSISSTMIVARPIDKNYNVKLFDEIIQGYYIYHNELDCDEALDAYDLRDAFLVQNVDLVFWYSNKILGKTSSIFKCAEYHKKQIIYV